MQNFEGLGLHPSLMQGLAHMKFMTPTPVQAQSIPVALEGRDILGSAQTGTGKTGAYAIPLVDALLKNPQGSALVLAPTRELARQVMDMVHELLGRNSTIRTAFLIGGEPMGKQLSQLKSRPRIIIGTPGRINDHLARGSLSLKDAGFLVLDETDRMLDMGFGIQLEKIFKFLPAKRQTLMFSATLPQAIVKMSENYLVNPVRVAIGSTHNTADNIKLDVIKLDEGAKYDELVSQLYDRKGSIIVFVKTKYGTERLAQKLNREDLTAEAIHGDLKQSRRDRVIRDFRDRRYRILVATDVAARGLDIPHIEHVVNYDLPQVPEDYIHRIGRTARAGASGSALCLITPADGRKWHAIEMLLNPDLKPMRGEPRKSGGKGNGPDRKRGGKPSFAKGGKFSRPRTDARSDQPRDARRDQPRDARPADRRDEPRRDDFRRDAPRGDMARRDDSRRDGAPANRSGENRGDRPQAPGQNTKKKFHRGRGPRPVFGGGSGPRRQAAA